MKSKNILIALFLLTLFEFGSPQNYNDYSNDDVGEERLHHKKKKQRYRPCRRSYDEKTLAVNLYVNNYPNNGGYNDPCSSGYPGNGPSSGGHLGGLLGSHPILSGLLGNLGLGGNPSGGNRPGIAIATAIAGAGPANTQPESLGGGQGGNLGTILGAVAGAAGGAANSPIEDNVHEEQEKRGPLFPRDSSIVGAYLDLFGFGGGYNRPQHTPQRPYYNQYNNNQVYSNPGYGGNTYGGYQNNYYRDQDNSKFLGHSTNDYRQVQNQNGRPNYRLFK